MRLASTAVSGEPPHFGHLDLYMTTPGETLGNPQHDAHRITLQLLHHCAETGASEA